MKKRNAQEAERKGAELREKLRKVQEDRAQEENAWQLKYMLSIPKTRGRTKEQQQGGGQGNLQPGR